MEKKLEVRNLKISFRTQGGILQAVRNISFDLYKGETLAIVGESGSGKSVTNRTIMGILAGNGFVESGEIIYDGQDLVQISEDDFHKIRGDQIAMLTGTSGLTERERQVCTLLVRGECLHVFRDGML